MTVVNSQSISLIRNTQRKKAIALRSCVIFCAAEFDRLLAPIEDSFLIAADGGLRHLERLGLTPDAVIGDFDSLRYVPQGAAVYPVEKDDTDAMLAVKLGLSKGFRDFVLYGSLDGPRLDHTVANYQLLKYLADRGAHGVLVGCSFCAAVVQNGSLRLKPHAEGDISVFCIGPDAQGVSIRGLYYQLENGTLSSGFPLGVSNHFIGQEATVSVEKGALLVLWRREAGLPEFQ